MEKSLRYYISLVEWVDPGPPCKHCGLPSGSHRVKFTPKHPGVSYMDPDQEWADHDITNAEDHEYEPSAGYKPLSQAEAGVVGYDLLSGATPDDIYQRIDRARHQIKRVGKKAGKLKSVK